MDPSVAQEIKIQNLFDWETRTYRPRRKSAWAASLVLHMIGAGVLFLIPASPVRIFETNFVIDRSRSTPLIAPPKELTQRDPNRGKIGREFNLESLLSRPALQSPSAPPSTTRPAAPFEGPPERSISRPVVIPEPPSVQAAAPVTPSIGTGIIPPPRIQPEEERPKLAFETPRPALPAGPPTGNIPVPRGTVGEAVQQAARSRSGGIIVGDFGEGAGGLGGGLNLPPSPGRTASSLELLSDPMGVDFRPYLIRILASVRRNWLAVIPQSAKLGRQGRVVIQFAISADGRVPKLVIATPSGADALDRAAVAGISASTPFPPLPMEFRGNQVRLQFVFSYNLPGN